MDKHSILAGYLNKQKDVIEKLHSEVISLDLEKWELQYVFALKTQQLFTAAEDLMKTVAGTFENTLDDYGRFHLKLLKVMSIEVPDIRPALISDESYKLLDKLRSFRHFIRHGYNYVLDKEELILLQNQINTQFQYVLKDIEAFSIFLQSFKMNKD